MDIFCDDGQEGRYRDGLHDVISELKEENKILKQWNEILIRAGVEDMKVREELRQQNAKLKENYKETCNDLGMACDELEIQRDELIEILKEIKDRHKKAATCISEELGLEIGVDIEMIEKAEQLLQKYE